MNRKEIIAEIKQTLKENGIKKARIFGSFARKERKFNDIDIAIEAPNDRFSLFDLVEIEQKISKKVGKKIDLMTFNSISPHIKPYVKKEMVALL